MTMNPTDNLESVLDPGALPIDDSHNSGHMSDLAYVKIASSSPSSPASR